MDLERHRDGLSVHALSRGKAVRLEARAAVIACGYNPPLLRQLGDIHTRLEQRIAAAPAKRTYRAKQALTKIETWHRALSQLALQSLSRLHMAPGA